MATQNERILQYLRSHDGITTMEAGDKLRIFRLSERIRELESEGFKFSHTPETTQNARVIRYRLLKAALPHSAPETAARQPRNIGTEASAAPHEQLIHVEYTDQKGKPQKYAYIAVGFTEKPAW